MRRTVRCLSGGGVIPMRMEALEPVPDSRNPAGVDPPDHVLNFRLD